VRKIGAGGWVAPVEEVGEQVILRDQIVWDAERMQDQRAGKSGAILAGGAMDHQWGAVLQQMSEQRTEAWRVVPHITAVGIAHHLERLDRRNRRAGGADRAKR